MAVTMDYHAHKWGFQFHSLTENSIFRMLMNFCNFLLQMQWNPQPSSNVLCPQQFSPTAPPYPGSATYSFTADFRPSANSHNENSNGFPSLHNSNSIAQQHHHQGMGGGSLMEHVRNTPSPLASTSEQKPFYQSNICYTPPKNSPVYEVSIRILNPK